MGDWAVMARSALDEMKLLDASTLRVHARGVTRVSHIGPEAIALKDAAGFEPVANQLLVWKAMWTARKPTAPTWSPAARNSTSQARSRLWSGRDEEDWS